MDPWTQMWLNYFPRAAKGNYLLSEAENSASGFYRVPCIVVGVLQYCRLLLHYSCRMYWLFI